MTHAAATLDALARLARAGFHDAFGGAARLFQAPGRINLIGEHTDYSGGLVMPAAVNRWCVVAAAPRSDRRLRLVAETLGERAELDLADLAPRGAWSDYVAGVAQVLSGAGVPVRGADLWITSTVPIGGGLSSSAAIEVATALALLALADRTAAPLQVAQWAQRAENAFVGMPCGLMDPFAAAHGAAGKAMMLNCGALTWTEVPLPATARFLVIDSLVRHALVDGGYAERRRDCEAAAAILGVDRLGEATPALLEAARDRTPPRAMLRARHVVEESLRVQAAAKALQVGDLAALGSLMDRSHASLRDLMAVSTPEVDALAAIARRTPGVLGARIMGGGFGGSVIALSTEAKAGRAMAEIQSAYGEQAGRRPDAFVCETVGAAGELPS
jgi:galactokinase